MALTEIGFTAIGLRFVLACSVFFIVLMFFSKIRKARKSDIELSPFLGFVIFFLSLTISHILFAYYDYIYIEDPLRPPDLFLYKICILAGYLGIIGLVFASEKMLGKTKFAFTIFNIICCVSGIVFLNSFSDLKLLTYIYVPVNIVFILAIFLNLFVFKTKGEIRQKMNRAFYCLLGFGVFYFLDTDLIESVTTLNRDLLKIISYSGSLAALILWGFIFLSFETFTEFGWRDKMKELFIIGPNREPLIHYSFAEGASSDLDFISSGLTGIKDILMEMLESETPLKVVDHQDLKIIFEYGAHSTIILLTYENLRIYHSKIASFIQLFERLFHDFFVDWKGDTAVFLPANQLIKEYFS